MKLEIYGGFLQMEVPPKMVGENNGKSSKVDDFGGTPILRNLHLMVKSMLLVIKHGLL